jgi:IS1 family transposase
MSKASVETIEVKPAVPAVVEEVVKLEMTRREAEIVRLLLGTCTAFRAEDTFELYCVLDDALGGYYRDTYQLTTLDDDRIDSMRVVKRDE